MSPRKIQCRCLHIFLGFTFLIPLGVRAQTNEVNSVLTIYGSSNHDWKQTTEVTKGILEESGRFKVDVNTIPVDNIEGSSWLPELEKYAVVIQNTNNIDKKNTENKVK